ncbi:AlkA N-terminal domain-containing protein [Tersicoccus sp. MR15.9]|uniref:DNA-3-methyladenine glycosylase family protein n=1 Tax=Tersicoccus mangrovi TaxID=3121635 RepID=UPI002FE59196
MTADLVPEPSDPVPTKPMQIETELPVAGPFDPAVFAFLAQRRIAGVEVADERSYQRSMDCSHGHALMRVWWDGARVQMSATLEDVRDADTVITAARHLLSLDADPRLPDAALADDPVLGPSVRRRPGLRVGGSVEPHEMLLRAMIGQQISEAAARTALHRLAEHAPATRLPAEGIDRFFPDAAVVAEHGRTVLRGPGRRIDSVVTSAERIAGGDLDLRQAATTADLAAMLLPLPGIGPWTVGYVALRWLGDPDVFLPGDLAVRAGLTRLAGAPARLSPAAVTAMARAWAPWRSWAVLHAWQAHLAPSAS